SRTTVGLEGKRFRYRMLDHNGWTICPVRCLRLRSRSVWKGRASLNFSRPSHHSIPMHLGPGRTRSYSLLILSSTMFVGVAPIGNQNELLQVLMFSIRYVPTACTAPPNRR